MEAHIGESWRLQDRVDARVKPGHDGVYCLRWKPGAGQPWVKPGHDTHHSFAGSPWTMSGHDTALLQGHFTVATRRALVVPVWLKGTPAVTTTS